MAGMKNSPLLIFLVCVYFVSLLLPSLLVFDYKDYAAAISYRRRPITMDESKGSPSMLPDFLHFRLPRTARIALLNLEQREWPPDLGIAKQLKFDRISNKNLTWKHFFPIWIDESGRRSRPSCPEMPMPDYGFDSDDLDLDLVVVSIPSTYNKDGKLIGRDLDRLQAHLVAADAAVRIGRNKNKKKITVVVRTECRPMMELFRCKDMVQRDGMWWLYELDVNWLAAKLALPVGTCMLGSPVKSQVESRGKKRKKMIKKKMKIVDGSAQTEAYATVIHSSDEYVCGAITLARSLVEAGTTRDLILLHDASIPVTKLKALSSAGWNLRLITRIHNPHAKKGAYNFYNYTKLRLWQLTGYDKIVFIDADVVVLKNVDFLFGMPELSATTDSTVLFNSGVMVIEPSNCSFGAMLDRLEEIVPYNGGDQGFLNQIFVWWHRLPQTVNYKKIFQNSVDSRSIGKKNRLFESNPPAISTIHYFGIKPWQCYRDYDCNWNMKSLNVYANDAAHRRWWSIHDRMPDQLKRFCKLTSKSKATLEYFLKKATQEKNKDGHWKIQIKDRRNRQ
ncbi:UDP-glucuronate:xylan alpha-glucuronosyltransferase 2 [Zostera marina]|uniref:Hexosyltransferase n=1 Tax=Zostera marina TaxID=29655 RepID=A0A0K9P4D9_ZOSMR|nr:UDP-glucuronate:xylan alpha-glucuronosyltransferase 2 [Zostera marina]